METSTVADIFAGILLIAVASVLASLAVPKLRRLLTTFGLALAAAVAVGATAGSLYFSEVANFNPCDMCWVQRIFMYPLAVILPIAALRRDRNLIPYAGVLATIGLVVSIYHIQLQLFPNQSTTCDLTNPCSAKWIEALGFATIPTMAGASFALIIVSLLARWRVGR